MTNEHYKRKEYSSEKRYGDIQWKEKFKNEWILDKITPECIKFSEGFGRYVKNNGLTTSQIRNVFGELKRIQMKGFDSETTSFLLLKPKMAYAVARDGKRGLRQLTDVFNAAYELVDVDSDKGNKQFENLMHFMESILAYHKSFGGK